jgi:hypothetical protein
MKGLASVIFPLTVSRISAVVGGLETSAVADF